MRFIREPFRRFIELETSSSIILFAATVAALVLANSVLGPLYESFWQQPLTIGFPDFQLTKPLLLWINDGLMAVFFFVIGLEIKRELLVGELSEWRQAVLPIAAAVGGMVAPVALFFLFLGDGAGAEGWGIPMATDIAFTLGILKVLGNRVPIGLKVFLTAYAIIDDLGAVLVIALFYSGEIYWNLIGYAALCLAVLAVAGRLGSFSKLLFFPLGLVVWVLFLKAGIHPTIAGILLGLLVPLRQRVDIREFETRATEALQQVVENPSSDRLLSKEQIAALDTMEHVTTRVQPPLQRLENRLHDWVSFIIIPIFALANAGVALGGGLPDGLISLAASIGLALVLGKAVGISLFSYAALRLGLADLPSRVTFPQIVGIGFLGGLGFTMALFIANLAFVDAGFIQAAKVGILGGSLLAALLGYGILRFVLPTRVVGGPEEEE